MTNERDNLESKLVRALVERILKDDFSPRDCRLAADAFERKEFSKRIASIIRAVAGSEAPSPSAPGKLQSQPRSSSFGKVDDLYALYKRKKISKDRLADLIEQVTVSPVRNRDAITAREMLTNFIAIESDSDINNLRSLLEPGGKTDPFLRGILNRK